MTNFVLDHLGSLRIGAQGVGSPDTPATLTSAHVAEVARGGRLKYNPSFTSVSSMTPRRDGQEQIVTGKTVDYNYETRLRAFTVPATDDSSRPSIDNILLGAGYIDSYDNNGGAGPYQRIYELQDFPEKMDSVTIEDIRGVGTNATAKKKVLSNGRHSIKFGAMAGQMIVIPFAGKGKGYALTDSGSALPNDALPTGQILTLENATVLLETVGGGTVYSGPFKGFELDAAMNVIEVPDGSASGLVNEVLLQPKAAAPGFVIIQDQLLAAFNAEYIRDNNTGAARGLHLKLTLPSPASANDVVIFERYVSIGNIDDEALVEDVMGAKINFLSMWNHASAPGVTPNYSDRIIFQTTP